MKRELENELRPFNISQVNSWIKIVNLLFTNPDKTLPVFFADPDTDKVLGDYFFRIVKENEKVFVQAEGFSNRDIESSFTGGTSDWEVVQPGIYRIDISDDKFP
jgi:hypothetical protein